MVYKLYNWLVNFTNYNGDYYQDLRKLERNLVEYVLPEFSSALSSDGNSEIKFHFYKYYIFLKHDGIYYDEMNDAYKDENGYVHYSFFLTSYYNFTENSISCLPNIYGSYLHTDEFILKLAEEVFKYMENRPSKRLEKNLYKSELFYPMYHREVLTEKKA